jgi:hypothetical protein
LQAHRVKLADGKRPDTALGAPRTTRQPVTAPSRSIGRSGIYDLHQFAILGLKVWQAHI